MQCKNFSSFFLSFFLLFLLFSFNARHWSPSNPAETHTHFCNEMGGSITRHQCWTSAMLCGPTADQRSAGFASLLNSALWCVTLALLLTPLSVSPNPFRLARANSMVMRRWQMLACLYNPPNPPTHAKTPILPGRWRGAELWLFIWTVLE